MKRNSFPIWHLLLRLAGLTGLMAAAVGLVIWLSLGETFLGKIVFFAGAGLLVLALLGEIGGIFGLLVSRRGAVGVNVALQIVLAGVLVIGVNVFSFNFSHRFDLTRHGLFTLPEDLRQQLSQLRDETDIIVYLRNTGTDQDSYDAAAEHRIVEQVKDLAEQFQNLGPRFRLQVLDKRDVDFEKVKLPKIRKKSEKLADAILEATENSIFFYAQTRKKTDASTAGKEKQDPPIENVQRLSFHDVFLLDKQASRNARNENGNLVLNYQGPGPIARKILNIQEKKPRIALGVIHELLSFRDLGEETMERFTSVAAGKTLHDAGFDTQDIILKKWFRGRMPEPAVFTFDSSRFETLEKKREVCEKKIKVYGNRIELLTKTLDKISMPLEDFNRKFVIVVTELSAVIEERDKGEQMRKDAEKKGQRLRLVSFTQDMLDDQLYAVKISLNALRPRLEQEQRDLDKTIKDQKELNIEELYEQNRITDLQAKLTRQLAQCDLLILPRLTIFDLPQGGEGALPNRIHRLDDAQFAAIKEFIDSGKPVLFCLGPANEDPDIGLPDPGPDPVERYLTELGFQMPKQTIIFDAELESFAKVRGDMPGEGKLAKVPPVLFDWKPGDGLPPMFKKPPASNQAIRTSLELTNKSMSSSPELDLRLRTPRPIYFKPSTDQTPALDATLFMAPAECWNEDQPFLAEDLSSFEPPKKDINKGTVGERRNGPFPIAAAVEIYRPDTPSPSTVTGIVGLAGSNDGPLPVMARLYQKPGPKTRLVVIGSGNVFTGKTLSVIQQKLLVDSCNWLLGRDDLLAGRKDTWQYPRVEFPDPNLPFIAASTVGLTGTLDGPLVAASELYPERISDNPKKIWLWIMRWGLPALAVFLGMMMWLVRRMR